MKFRIFILPILIVILTTATVYAQSGHKEDHFDASSLDQLTIRINSGMEIVVEGTDTPQLSYTYDFEGNKPAYERYFVGFNPEFEKKDGYGAFSIRYPEQSTQNVSYEIKKNRLVIKLPRQLKLEVSTQYSSLHISNIDRDTHVYNRSGSVTIENIGQALQVSNDYGDISARNIQGDVTLRARSSQINLSQVTGRVNIGSPYSKMSVSQIDGDVEVQNQSGTINAFNIQGSFSGKADYTEFKLTNIEGRTRLSSKSGNVTVDNIRDFSFEGEYTDVSARNIRDADLVDIRGRSATITLAVINAKTSVQGEYLDIQANEIVSDIAITNRSGTVHLKDIQGMLKYVGYYTDIELNNFNGKVIRMNSKNGSIKGRGIKGISAISIQSEYGDIDLDLDQIFEGQLHLITTYGSIKHNFDLTNSKTIQKSQRNVVQGTVGTISDGNSSNRIMIQAANGNIRVNAN
ncbi:MAG: DUF4097 domain-containing protein [Balneolaceae bacterium]|nr:DUF4097 domain-containing protein [Balneolaceae bacterium]